MVSLIQLAHAGVRSQVQTSTAQHPFVVSRWLRKSFYSLNLWFTRLLGFSFYSVAIKTNQQLIRDDTSPESLYTKIIHSTKRYNKGGRKGGENMSLEGLVRQKQCVS